MFDIIFLTSKLSDITSNATKTNGIYHDLQSWLRWTRTFEHMVTIGDMCILKKTLRNVLAWYDQRNEEVCCFLLLGNCPCVLWEFVTSGSHDLWSPVDFFYILKQSTFQSNDTKPSKQMIRNDPNLLPMSFMSSQFSNRWCCATRGEGELRDGCLTKNTRVLMSWICPPWQGSHILWDIHKKKTQPFQFVSYLGYLVLKNHDNTSEMFDLEMLQRPLPRYQKIESWEIGFLPEDCLISGIEIIIWVWCIPTINLYSCFWPWI